MYSVVLLMALSTSGDVPAFGKGGHGCDGATMGCYGGSACYGCTGYSCMGCYGGCSGVVVSHGCDGGCHGCRGGGLFSRIRAKFQAKRSHGCHGCDGGSGCCGGSSWGCHGCTGGVVTYGCTGGSSWGCHGCTGGVVTYGCTGGVVTHGCTGGVPMMAAPAEMPATPEVKPETKTPEAKPEAKPEGDKAVSLAAPATMVVTLPADASLTIDGRATRSTTSTRVFETPALQPGKTFVYDLKAEIVRDGRTLTVSKEVTVEAGKQSAVELTFPTASVVQK